MDDFQAMDHVVNLIRNCGYIFEDNNHIYYQVASKNLYFVVEKIGKVIITLTPISAEKMLTIYEK